LKRSLTIHRAIIGVLTLCLLAVMRAYWQKSREVERLRRIVETPPTEAACADYIGVWRDISAKQSQEADIRGTYTVWLEKRLKRYHEPGDPFEWWMKAETAWTAESQAKQRAMAEREARRRAKGE
jgi:hypothetical protein